MRRGKMGICLQSSRSLVKLTVILLSVSASAGEPSHGLAHFDYANPDAPKGGTVRFALTGTFNNLHPYVDKGIAVAYIAPGSGVFYDTLLKKSWDELSSYYGYLAENVELADDYSWVAYTLRENAYWHDGEPVTVEDVIWTFNTIKAEGSISWKNAYRDIVSVEQTGPRTFRFNFSETVEKTPQLAIQTVSFAPLPKHYWKDKTFNATTLVPPLGNGPYRCQRANPSEEIARRCCRPAHCWKRPDGWSRTSSEYTRRPESPSRLSLSSHLAITSECCFPMWIT